MNFARDSEMRIQAVALAREGIEAVYNIRNTNWLRFPAKRESCWNILNYDKNCMNGGGWLAAMSGRYFLDHKNGLWNLSTPTSMPSENAGFTAFSIAWFGIDVDEYGNYISRNTSINEWCANAQIDKTVRWTRVVWKTVNCRSPFARIIDIKSLDDTAMEVTSTVLFRSSTVKKIELKTTITNWKANYQKHN